MHLPHANCDDDKYHWPGGDILLLPVFDQYQICHSRAGLLFLQPAIFDFVKMFPSLTG